MITQGKYASKAAAKVGGNEVFRDDAPSKPVDILLSSEEMNRYKEIYRDMRDDGVDRDTAGTKAMQAMFLECKVAQFDDFAKHWDDHGYLEVYSARLLDRVILCKGTHRGNIVNPEELAVYSAEELINLKGISDEELRVIHKGKRDLNARLETKEAC